jgi:hypothetical protein
VVTRGNTRPSLRFCDQQFGRFVRAQLEQPLRLIPYQQDEWVRAQGYQERSAEETVQLWTCLNQSIWFVMTTMPAACRLHTCELADGTTVTLEWLMTDYVEHLEHHLKQIFKES